MDAAVVRITLSLIGPGILLVFGIAFVGAWLIERKRQYLLFLAGACVSFTLGASAQILRLPTDLGLNAVISALFYTSAVILAAEGIMRRSGRGFGWMLDAALLVGVVGLMACFYYGYPSLLARVYIQNFSYGLILLAAALRLTSLTGRRVGDRILFWVLLVFALQFFPRTLFTLGFYAPSEVQAFANSVFWQTLQLSLAVLGASLAFAVLAAAIADILDDLRQDRDMDGLTGILNRSGFEARIKTHLVRPEGPASLILCDIDYFKGINDTYGHDIGDVVLKMFGSILSLNSKELGVVGRIGGEEFATFLPRTDFHEALRYAESLRNAIASSLFPIPDMKRRVTASFGVVEVRPGDTWQSLYKRADIQLYEAKKLGRNRTAAQM